MQNEKLEKLILSRNALENLAKKYPDELNDAMLAACGEFDLKSEEKIRQNFDEKIDQNRDLQIGVVGRVKAGKSSLLNALLFDGNTILPKAATPMTAALTILSYSEQIEVRVHFFDEDDIRALREKSEAYDRQYERRIAENLEAAKQKTKELKKLFDEKKSRERAEKAALRELQNDIGLSGAHTQYAEILKSPISPEECREDVILHPSSLAEIAASLSDYVGSSGKYMPFTQSVEISFPEERLRGIRIVDTPGFNDPVPSREARAYQLLKSSDVVLILSPAGQFISSVDMDVLSKITQKEGLRELFVIASQVDSQLFGDEYDYLNKDLTKVLDEVKKRLGGQLSSSLSSINSAGVFDQLLQDSEKRVLVSSGNCHSMYLTWNARKSNWDEGEKQIWKNLSEEYPDYFSEKEDELSCNSLKMLGNMDLVESKIDEVKNKKGKILEESAAQILTSLSSAVDGVQKAMKVSLNENLERIRQGNLTNLENELAKSESFCSKIEPGIKRVFQESVTDWSLETTKNLRSFVQAMFGESKSDANASRTTFQETHSYKSGGFLGFFQDTNYYTVDRVRVSTAQIRSSIEDFASRVNDNLKLEVEGELEQLKRKIASKISILWAEKASEQSMNPDEVANKIRAIIEGIDLPDYELPLSGLPSCIAGGGTLYDNDGEEALSQGRAYLSSLSRTAQQTISESLSNVANILKQTDMASEILGRYKKELKQLVDDIKNQKNSVERIENVKKELDSVI